MDFELIAPGVLTESDYRNYDDGFSYPIPDDLSFPFESECTVRAYDSLVLRRRADVTEATAAGIKYTSKKILQYAVILLGFGLNPGEIAKVGASSLPIIVSTITTSLAISFVLCRVMHIPLQDLDACGRWLLHLRWLRNCRHGTGHRCR